MNLAEASFQSTVIGSVQIYGMPSFLLRILEISLAGSFLILSVLLLRKAARRHLPAWLLSAAWSLILLRLLMPVEITAPCSILSLLQQAAPQRVQAASLVMQGSSIPLAGMDPWLLVWLGGIVIAGMTFAWITGRQHRIFKTALPVQMTEKLREICTTHRLPKRVRIYCLDRISTPLTYGFFKPRILLPGAIKLTNEELGCVIAHECAHIRRGDAVLKALMILAVCCHWFNPLVWLMVAAFGRDMEIACDQRALRTLGEKTRQVYAQTLLDLEERKAFGGILYGCFSQGSLEERIHSLIVQNRPKAIGTALASALLLVIFPLFATNPGKMNIITVSSVAMVALPQMDGKQISVTVVPGTMAGNLQIVEVTGLTAAAEDAFIAYTMAGSESGAVFRSTGNVGGTITVTETQTAPGVWTASSSSEGAFAN